MSNNQENCQIIKTIVNFPHQLDTVRKEANSSTVDPTALASLAANASGELLTTPMDVPDPEPDEMRCLLCRIDHFNVRIAKLVTENVKKRPTVINSKVIEGKTFADAAKGFWQCYADD